MALIISYLTPFIHLCFGLTLVVLPLPLLLPGCTISSVCLPTKSWSVLFTCPNNLRIAFLQLSVMLSTFSLFPIVSRFVSFNVWPHAHEHMNFIFVTSSLFTWELLLQKPYGTSFFLVNSTTSSANIICKGVSFLMFPSVYPLLW